MILRIARQDGRDAVFDVPAQLIRAAPTDPQITVRLTDDPAVTAQRAHPRGCTQADPETRTFEVKVGLTDPPAAMRLGATVTGRMETEAVPIIEIPATALTNANNQRAVWIVDPANRTVSMRNVDVLRFDQARSRFPGTRYRRGGCHRGRAGSAPGAEGPIAGIGAMSGFNLSEWALEHRSIDRLSDDRGGARGRPVLFQARPRRRSVVCHQDDGGSAAWPGATVDDMLKQVTERLERKLQETPKLDFLRSFTRDGVTTIFVNLKGSATAREIPDIWYHVRKSIGDIRHTLPAGIVGPGFNDDFGDTFGIIYGFTADGFTHRELRDRVEDIRSKLLTVADVSKIEILGAQDERIFIEFSMEELASLGIDRSALIAALQAQNVVQPAGTIQSGNEALSVRVSGAFRVRTGRARR